MIGIGEFSSAGTYTVHYTWKATRNVICEKGILKMLNPTSVSQECHLHTNSTNRAF